MAYSMGLKPGQTYRVIKPFVDFDKYTHPIGETWTFVTTNFLPYEDGMTLHVIREGMAIYYRLQWRDEEQADIIGHFLEFVEEC